MIKCLIALRFFFFFFLSWVLVKFLREPEPIFTFLLSWFNNFEIQSNIFKSKRQSYLVLVSRCALKSWVWCFMPFLLPSLLTEIQRV